MLFFSGGGSVRIFFYFMCTYSGASVMTGRFELIAFFSKMFQ